jgi:hypothetical protein
MGRIVSPNIVNDGLIFYLDAANKRSYPGSGTNVSSLIGLDRAALQNSTGFSTENKGTFTLDGSNQYIEIVDSNTFSFGDGSNDSPFSISAWVNMTDATKFRLIQKVHSAFGSGLSEWYFLTTGADKLRITVLDESASAYEYAETSALTSLQGQWLNLVATYDGSGGTSANIGMNIYINGVVQSVTRADSGTYTAMENLPQPVYIGRYANVDYASGKIAVVKIYNKELSASEVLQNYNALLPRFT